MSTERIMTVTFSEEEVKELRQLLWDQIHTNAYASALDAPLSHVYAVLSTGTWETIAAEEDL